MGLGFGFVLLEIAGGAGFCVCAAGDRIFCVRDANIVRDANSRMPLLFCFLLLESVLSWSWCAPAPVSAAIGWLPNGSDKNKLTSLQHACRCQKGEEWWDVRCVSKGRGMVGWPDEKSEFISTSVSSSSIDCLLSSPTLHFYIFIKIIHK